MNETKLPRHIVYIYCSNCGSQIYAVELPSENVWGLGGWTYYRCPFCGEEKPVY